MTIRLRNIDGTYTSGWARSANQYSARFTYELNDNQFDVLTYIDEWMTGCRITGDSTTDITIAFADGAAAIPSWISSNATHVMLWDCSGSAEEIVAITSITGNVITLAANPSGTYNDNQLDRCSFYSNVACTPEYNVYGGTGWRTVGASNVYFTAAASSTWNGNGDTLVRVSDAVSSSGTELNGVPASGNLIISGTNGETIAYSNTATTYDFVTSALTGDKDTGARVEIQSHVPRVRTYKANNDGGTAASSKGTYWKYMTLDVATTGYLFCKVWEAIVSITGEGTVSYDTSTTTKTQRFNNAAGDAVDGSGEFYLSASREHFFVTSVYTAASITYIGSSADNGASGICEFTRMHPSFPIGGTGAGYPTPFSSFSGEMNINSAQAALAGISTPRSIHGDASASTNRGAFVTTFGYFGYQNTSAAGFPLVTTDPITTRYRASDVMVYQLKTSTAASPTYVGNFMKIKFVGAGAPFDETTIRVNLTDSAWPMNASGTDTKFLLFPALPNTAGTRSQYMIAVPK